jgi:hypothetical protein
MMLMGQIMDRHHCARLHKRRLYIQAMKSVWLRSSKLQGQRNADSLDRTHRYFAKTETAVPLEVVQRGAVRKKEIVLIVALVANEIPDQLAKIGFVAARLRPQAVYVDCNFHQDQFCMKG